MISVVLLSGLLLAPCAVYASGWETVRPEKRGGRLVVSDSEIEITTGGGTIYINTTRNVNVQIFSILGSRIADDTLSPGVYQFVVPAHGVYIIKAGDFTCKIAV